MSSLTECFVQFSVLVDYHSNLFGKFINLPKNYQGYELETAKIRIPGILQKNITKTISFSFTKKFDICLQKSGSWPF